MRSTINILKFCEVLRGFNLDFSKFRGKYVHFVRILQKLEALAKLEVLSAAIFWKVP